MLDVILVLLEKKKKTEKENKKAVEQKEVKIMVADAIEMISVQIHK